LRKRDWSILIRKDAEAEAAEKAVSAGLLPADMTAQAAPEAIEATVMKKAANAVREAEKNPPPANAHTLTAPQETVPRANAPRASAPQAVGLSLKEATASAKTVFIKTVMKKAIKKKVLKSFTTNLLKRRVSNSSRGIFF
jgi:hypothetical protein